MIVSCPSCYKKYTISSDVLTEKKKQRVRCLDCKTIWTLESTPSEEKVHGLVEQEPSLKKPLLQSQEKNESSKKNNFLHRYKLDWILLIISLVLLGVFIYTEKDYFISKLPPKTIMFHKQASLIFSPEKSILL